MHGSGCCVSSDGEKYVGEYVDGVPHGKGVYTFKNGNVYEGDYCEGRIEGHGTIKFPDNRRFVGFFKDNKKHGRGRYEGATGVYEGDYRDGKKDGTGTFTWIDGSSYEGPWSNDFMHGDTGLKRERDGTLFRVHNDMGKLVSAVPIDPHGAESLGAAAERRPLSNFSDAALDSSIGPAAVPAQPSLRPPVHPSAAAAAAAGGGGGSEFHRTLSKPGGGGGGGGGAALPAPVAWVREQWNRLTDAVGCGGDGRSVGGVDPAELCGGCGYSK
jgi:hypothetical protein